ncbi:MAG: hypothetical protein JSU04_00175 [Bdellovibrionales bacterium]|nr:hypothetical protein [Bdellovibrionales bacterium]
MSSLEFTLRKIEKQRREFLLKHYRMPNLIVMGYGVFDQLIVANESVMKKIEKDEYTLLGMKVLLYPEKQFKDNWELKLMTGDVIE